MDAGQELRALAEKLAKEEWPIGSDEQHELDADLFERVLRESGLLELMQAAEDYRKLHAEHTRNWRAAAYDAARAKWRKAVGLDG